MSNRADVPCNTLIAISLSLRVCTSIASLLCTRSFPPLLHLQHHHLDYEKCSRVWCSSAKMPAASPSSMSSPSDAPSSTASNAMTTQQQQQRRIADLKAAVQREQSRLQQHPSPPPSPVGQSSSSSSSAASSAVALPLPGRPFTWTRVQERMRTLHALDAKCSVEDAAVRQAEREVQGAMEASLGRKAALMAQLEHICREEALLSAAETLLNENSTRLAKAEEAMTNTRTALAQQVQETAESNRRRRHQLASAADSFEQRRAFREKERQSLREDVAKIDARVAAMEAQTRATVQRVSDGERKIRLEEANLRTGERRRIESLQLEVRRLCSEVKEAE